MKYPLSSVIIPVYNNQKGIDACLAALFVQTYPSNRYEVIVVDNFSDPPIKIKPQFSKIARLVVCRKPGAYAARNAGIKASCGEILLFTDADCVPSQSWINKGVEALLEDQGQSIIGGNVVFFVSDKPSVVELYQSLSGFMQNENIVYRKFSATANLFTTKNQFANAGMFNETLLSGGDREWCWRADNHGYQVKYIPEAVVYTKPRTSLISAIHQARRVAGGRYVLKQMKANHISFKKIKQHQSVFSAAKWILSHSDVTKLQRVQVFFAATVIKTAYILEIFKLSMGLTPERR